MSFTFDGPTKVITLDFGVTEVDVKDLYSRWKEFAIAEPYWAPAFRPTGGDPTTGDNVSPSYFFLLNGWKVRPHEADHGLDVSFNLYTDDGSSPFLPTLGDYTVSINNRASDIPGTTILEGLSGDVSLILKFLKNKLITDPNFGTITLYDDDNTALLQGPLYEDVAGTIPYRGEGADHRGQMT